MVRVEAVQQVRLLAEHPIILLNELLSYLQVHTRSVGQRECGCGEVLCADSAVDEIKPESPGNRKWCAVPLRCEGL